MPELPEVETIKRGLSRKIVGKTLRSVEIRLPKIIALGPKTVGNIRKFSTATAHRFKKLIAGRKVTKVSRRAKMLLLSLGDAILLVHLKMTGQLIFQSPGERGKAVKLYNATDAPRLTLPHKHTHVIFNFTDSSKLYYNDLRQFGYLRLVNLQDLPKVRELSEYGPEPFDRKVNWQYLKSRAKLRPRLTIKQFLMDAKVVAGIGNIYSDEILYRAKIVPKRPLRQISDGEWRAVVEHIRKVLRSAIEAQGSSVGDFFKLDGSEGRFGLKHMVYQRYGEKCRKCGNIVEAIKLGGRTSSYCPRCQR